MSENEEKDHLKELSDLNEQILSLVKKYNVLANTYDFESRLGVMTGNLYRRDRDDYYNSDEITDSNDNKNQESCNEYIRSNGRYENVSLSVEAPEADIWFPSSFCYV